MLGLLKAVVMLAPLLALASPVLLEPLSTVNGNISLPHTLNLVLIIDFSIQRCHLESLNHT